MQRKMMGSINQSPCTEKWICSLQMTLGQMQRSFFSDVQDLYKKIEASTDGQAYILEVDDMTVMICLRPKSGFNAHALFHLTIQCTSTYPKNSPRVIFNTPIFHPNIDPLRGIVCLSLLHDWKSCYSLLDIVKALLYLIDHPNFDDVFNEYGTVVNQNDVETNTKRVLAGLCVNGVRYEANTAWCEWALDNGCLRVNESGEYEIMTKKVELVTDQEGGKALDMESEESLDNSSIASSDTIPSVAKLRYSLESLEKMDSSVTSDSIFTPFRIEAQRVLIWQPGEKHEPNIYYFIEIVGGINHLNELGEFYLQLFVGNVLRCNQVEDKYRQTCSNCPWFPFDNEKSPYVKNATPNSASYSSISLDKLFEAEDRTMETLTSDFCPWSASDGLGIHDLFGKLFFIKGRRGANFTSFLDADNGEEDEYGCFARLFDTAKSVKSDDEESQFENGATHESKNLQMCEEVIYADDNDTGVSRTPTIPLSSSFESVDRNDSFMQDCIYCIADIGDMKTIMHTKMPPQWKFFFNQTRWSIRFAPQQKVDLTMRGIQIPPWRCSMGRLLADLCRYCKKNQEVRNLVLLDPMALSPLSPLLNLMWHYDQSSPHLKGVLWMTPLQALSPFYRVPLPPSPRLSAFKGDGQEELINESQPGAKYLRFLTLTGFLTNWVAWLSRVEVYACLGVSRFSPAFVSSPVAACLLHPLSLGCGQAPLVDTWPLWLMRKLLILSMNLPSLLYKMSFPLKRSKYRAQLIGILFPFSDLDEI